MTQLQWIALLCAYVVVVALGFVAGRFVVLPTEVNDAKLRAEKELKRKIQSNPLVILVNLLEMGLGAVGFVGMFFLWHLAPYLFAAAIFCKVFLPPYPATSWHAASGWQMMLFHVEFILDGAILVIAFFGPARHLFFQ